MNDMTQKKKRKCFESYVKEEDILGTLRSICSKVEPKGNGKYRVRYNNKNFKIKKKTDGYYAFITVPWWVWVFLGVSTLLAIISIFLHITLVIEAPLCFIFTVLIVIYKYSSKWKRNKFCKITMSRTQQ